MTAYSGQIARAKASIARKGQTVVWRPQSVVTGADPWREAAGPVVGPYAPKIVFLPVGLLGWEWSRTLNADGDDRAAVEGLMGAQDFTPALGDIIEATGHGILSLRFFDTLKPDGEPILYIMRFANA